MANLVVTLAIRDYDFISPLAMGDVKAEGIDLSLIRAFDALPRVTGDSAIHGGEASFSRTVQRFAAGDRSLVALPAFVMRAFRHRCFFVRRGSGLTDVAHLAGKRVGTDAWPASGNTWSRSILRGRGLDIWSIRWFVGSVNPGDPPPAADVLAPGVELAPAGRCLREMLLAGELDALMCPWPPVGFYEKDGQITRLYEDYRAVECDYYRRTKIYPAHHLVVLKRDLVDRHPWAVRSLYGALKQARELSDGNRWKNPDSSPWLLTDLEEQAALMGRHFQPYGFRENRPMVAAFCEEQLAQGLVAKPIAPEAIFEEFEQVVR